MGCDRALKSGFRSGVGFRAKADPGSVRGLTRMEATFWGLHLASKKNRPSIAMGICGKSAMFSVESPNAANVARCATKAVEAGGETAQCARITHR